MTTDAVLVGTKPAPKKLILAAHHWGTNGHLIADVARLGYLEGRVLDPTYGRGTFWKVWRPENLTFNDQKMNPTFDFRDTPWVDDSFDAIAFDPPYVAMGGRKTTDESMIDMHDRFGMRTAPRTPKDVQQLIDDGLTEMRRLVAPRGTILVKCQDYVSGGKLFPGTFNTYATGIALGLELEDRFERLQKNARPQPGNRHKKGVPTTQQHARHNFSTLFVFRAPR